MQGQAAPRNKALVMITGASSGIGRSTAKVFAEEGHPLLLISRGIEPLPELKSDQVLYEQVDLKGLLNCTKAVLAGMLASKSGTIINISSLSDRKTTPVAVAYTATKYAVRAATESLRESAAKDGVRFMNLAPAYVKTNIHKNMGISFEEYCQMLGNPDFMEPEQVAEIILYCWKLPPNICVRDLVVARLKQPSDPNSVTGSVTGLRRLNRARARARF